jgi:hypothetical protein
MGLPSETNDDIVDEKLTTHVTWVELRIPLILGQNVCKNEIF